MYCPVCREEPLIVLEHEEVEVDYCPQCHGVWLDSEEADLLFGSHAVCERFMRSGRPNPAAAKRKLRCPECGKVMETDTAGTAEPVTYDRCVQGHGMWFDEGELAAIMRRGHELADGDKVEAFLQGLFGDNV